jgi:hypothetical protein
MGQVGDLIGDHGAAAARVLRPAEDPGLEEGPINDQLPAALEEVEQASLALGPIEFVRLLDGHPRHPSAFGGQGVTSVGQGLLLHEKLLVRGCPLLRRHDRGGARREMSFSVSLVCCHLFLRCFLKVIETIRSEKFPQPADTHRENSCRGSCSGKHYSCACDTCWAHMSLV